jgi:hypothetical protein
MSPCSRNTASTSCLPVADLQPESSHPQRSVSVPPGHSRQRLRHSCGHHVRTIRVAFHGTVHPESSEKRRDPGAVAPSPRSLAFRHCSPCSFHHRRLHSFCATEAQPSEQYCCLPLSAMKKGFWQSGLRHRRRRCRFRCKQSRAWKTGLSSGGGGIYLSLSEAPRSCRRKRKSLHSAAYSSSAIQMFRSLSCSSSINCGKAGEPSSRGKAQFRALPPPASQDSHLLPGREWLYSAEALAERKRVRELLTQSRELLKQLQAD